MPIASAGIEGKKFDPVPAGVHHAVCYSVVDLGTQPSSNPQWAPKHMVLISWELPGETVETAEGPKPRVISQDYGCSLKSKSKLLPVLQSWRGRPFTPAELERFEVADVIGANCLLNVIHNPDKDGSKVWANVLGVMPLPKGMPILKPVNPTVRFDIPKTGTIVFPEDLPEWIQNKIMRSREWLDRVAGGKHITETKALETGADPAITGGDDSAPF